MKEIDPSSSLWSDVPFSSLGIPEPVLKVSRLAVSLSSSLSIVVSPCHRVGAGDLSSPRRFTWLQMDLRGVCWLCGTLMN
jgi:hypothetical protein